MHSIKENGKVNIEASFNNHIGLLKYCAEKLEKIRDALPKSSEYELNADTHVISIIGDRNIIERLENEKLLDKYGF